MNRDNIFIVTNEDLRQLDPAEAVRFFRELLWAEARRLGIDINKINISDRIYVKDGGIDGTVVKNHTATASGLIKAGETGYQIKSGKAFKPWQKSVIKQELFGLDSETREHLGEGIRACLDAGGTYVLVCTRIDLVDSERRDALNHLNEYLKGCGYPNPQVEVWSQNNLIGFLQPFPPLALQVNGRSNAQFQRHQSWSLKADMRLEFVPGQAQEDLISQIRYDLRQNDDTVHVRVLGEPGIGKTRLVFEATRAEDLTPLVIYCTAARFRNSVLMNELLRNHFAAVLVIDECDWSSSSNIWNELIHRGARLKLVTISNDYETRAGGITYHDTPPLDNEQIRRIITPPLDNEQIRRIIQKYTPIPDFQADRWAELCSGSPRVAHVIGWNLENYPDDVLEPSTVDIWERYVAGNDDPASQEVEQRRLVLQHLALFKRFGFEDSVGERSVANEAQAIAKKVKMADPQITWARFQRIVYTLRKRKILQGEFTLYIIPKALHIKLWTEWWEIYGRRPFDLEEFTQGLKSELVEWFYEMFQYAAESEAASKIVTDLLGPDGPFRDGDYLNTKLGSRFFSALTEADPKSALRCLRRTLGTWDKETRLQFTEGRRYVIWALEKIAVWRDLFADAARLLLALGEAENEGCSNNASGVFARLFSPGDGPVAPTEASPEERFPVLKEAFESGSKERRALALKACDVALESRHFSRMAGPEYQGLRKEPQLWNPQTSDELRDAYRRVWQLLSNQLTRLPEDEREKAAVILLGHAGRLGKIPDLGNAAVGTVRTIAQEKYLGKKQVIEAISKTLFYAGKSMRPETRQRWEQLKAELVGSDFPSMMQWYVGMDLFIDQVDEDWNHVDQAQPQLEKLADQVVENPSLLQPELHWLVTEEAKNGLRFGYELGQRDSEFSLLPMLLGAQREASENSDSYFLGGYFRAMFDTDVALWEQEIERLVEDSKLNVLIPLLTRYSRGMTDKIGLRLLELAESRIISVSEFGVLGTAIESLSDEVFTEWIEFLLGFTDKSVVSIALDLYHRYYIFRKSAPTLSRDLTFRLLSHPSLFDESDGSPFNPMATSHWSEIAKAFLNFVVRKLASVLPRYLTFRLLSHPLLFDESDGSPFNPMVTSHWSEIAKVFLNLDPEKSLELAKLVLNHFGEEGSIFNYDSDICAVLTEITKRYPAEVWDHVSNLLENQNFSRTFALERWLADRESSEEGAFAHIPPEKIWEWVDEEPEKRSVYLARRMVLTSLSAETWPTSLARGLLVRYGHVVENLGGTLMSNYAMGGWHGPASLHYEGIKEELLRIETGENEENVKRWIDDYVDSLEQHYIEPARIEEERMF